MFYYRKTPFEHNLHSLLPRQQTTFSSHFHRPSSTFYNTNRLSSSYTLSDSHNSSLLYPSPSEYSSQQDAVGFTPSTFSIRQPITNPRTHLLNRTIDNCPTHLIGSKRTRWIKTGVKAKTNQGLISTLPPFKWSESYYDQPIHIHHRTPESLIRGLIYKLSNVRIYTIGTESDRPTRQNPHSLPALLQIQAIHYDTYSTVLLIDVEHLPPTTTSLFDSIQQLGRMIFSSSNKIMTWGDVTKQLNLFSQFRLFDISQVTNTLNLQAYFTLQWNLNHPHTKECLARHQPMVNAPVSDDVLICLIDTYDLDDEYDDEHPTNDFNTCICPSDIRPYKTKNVMWSLQKAMQFVFHEALDHTWHTSSARHGRTDLINYAILDLFASTKLFYDLERTKVSSTFSTTTTQLNTNYSISPSDRCSFVVITDSHGKFLPPITTRPPYTLTIKAIPGLQWVNPYDSRLCCKSLLLSSSFSSLLSNSRAILFIVGSNSTRSHQAPTILIQIEEILDLIRANHSHLNNHTSISISNTFPCVKPSTRFPTSSLLLSNIQVYNEGLATLSHRKQFSIVNFPITVEHLSFDGLHIRVEHLSILSENIQQYFDNLSPVNSLKPHSKNRSKDALKRRNKRHHDKLKIKQTSHTLVRPIARLWKLPDLKSYLKYKQIHYSRLPEIYNHQLRIQFNTVISLQHAERILLSAEFDESNYSSWMSQQQI
jgi:hypothetical protein